MVRRIVALLVTLAVVHVSVASALEQCASHAPAHCQSSKSHHQQAPGQQAPGRQAPGQHHASECCPIGGTCAPWAMTVAFAPQVRVSHATPAGVEPGRVFNLRLPPEPPPPRA
jgi:hypothetical protein